jgi:hypothetical protein
LCRMYCNDDSDYECSGCSVMKYTRHDQCINTPYYKYLGKQPNAAKDMVNFLKSLRQVTFKVGDIVCRTLTGYNYKVVRVGVDEIRVQNITSMYNYSHWYPATEFSFVTTPTFYIENDTLNVYPPLTGHEPNPLELSIAKWRCIVNVIERGGNVLDDGGAATSALCVSSHTCKGCPIDTFTNGHCCNYTPYSWWQKSHSLAAARAELAFLEELRDARL